MNLGYALSTDSFASTSCACVCPRLHTFKNGEVADADKLNESLQYILNNASGGVL